MSLTDRSRSTAQTVLTGSLLAAFAGSTAGATAAILTNASVKQYALSTSLNCGVFGATFLVIRQTFADHQQNKYPASQLKDIQTQSWIDLKSSTLAGATTGGLLSAVYRGPKSVISGSIMFGVLCGALQAGFSAGKRWRQDTIINRSSIEHSDLSASTPKGLLEGFSVPSWIPIRTISDEEYNELLDTRLKTLEDEVQEIEHKIKQSKSANQ